MTNIRRILWGLLLSCLVAAVIYFQFYNLGDGRQAPRSVSKLSFSSGGSLEDSSEVVSNDVNNSVAIHGGHLDCVSSLISEDSPVNTLSTPDNFLSCAQSQADLPNPSVDKIVSLLLAWSKIDPIGALEFSVSLHTSLRHFIFPVVLHNAAMSDPLQTENWLASSNFVDSVETWQVFYRGLAEIDPQNALYEILTNNTDLGETPNIKLAFVTSILGQWSRKNASEALAWFEQQQTGRGGDGLEGLQTFEVELITQLIKQDELVAESKILSLEAGTNKTLLLQELAKHLSAMDKEHALDWADSIEDPYSREIAMNTAFRQWSASGIPAQKVFDRIKIEPDENIKQSLTIEAVVVLSSHNSPELAEKFYQFPENTRPYIAEKIANSWINTDFGAAKEWVQSLPSGTAKDAAIFGIITTGFHHFDHPEHALEIAHTISDHAIRVETSKTILLNVASADSNKARIMLEEIEGLSAEQIEKMNYLISAYTE